MQITRKLLTERISSGRMQLSEYEGKCFFEQMGILVPRAELVQTAQQAQQAAERIGYPLVVKGLVEGITHKSEHGLVCVGAGNPTELARDFEQIRERCEAQQAPYQILIEEMAPVVWELIAAVNEDPVFGKVLMFGVGGIFVEVIKDVSFRLCPITRQDAQEMVEELRAKAIFSGVRGKSPVDREKVVDLLLRLGGAGGLCDQYGDLVSTIEINPLGVRQDGSLVALDSVMTLRDKTEQKDLPQRVEMRRLFEPESIAVVGVSDKPSMAKTFLEQTIAAGYAGRIYPVNPSHQGEQLFGNRVYGSLEELPEAVDYVYVAVPAKAVPQVVEQAAGVGAGFVHIISGGFAETGAAGRELEEAALAAARKGGVRLLGPNCMGLVSSRKKLVFSTGIGTRPGPVSLISQSGGITTEICRAGTRMGIRFDCCVSAGNCADLGIEDYLAYLGQDDRTGVIGIYAENIRQGRRFFELAREISLQKPIVLFKGGRSDEGAKAAASHTGALSSSYGLWQAMAKQCGITLVRTLEEFLNAMMAFQSLQPTEDNSVLLVSHSGGVVVTSADLCEDYHLTLPKLDTETQQLLRRLDLPPGANVSNPMDISLGVMAAKTKEGDDIQVIGEIFRQVGSRKSFGYDAFYLMADNVVESGGGKRLIENILRFAAEWGGAGGKRAGRFALAANCHTHPDYLRQACGPVRESGVPIFANINEMLQSLGWLAAYGRWRTSRTGQGFSTVAER